MTVNHVNHAWAFDCTLDNGKKISSWFYADTKEQAEDRIKNYMGARLSSIKEIDDPLETAKKQAESDRVREAIAKKKQEDFEARQRTISQEIDE